MNQLGMDTSEQPTSTGITKLGDEFDLSPEQVEKLQSVYQMEKAVSTRQFMGTSISADTSIKDFAGSTPQVIDGLEGEYEAGSVFKKTIETKIPGSDKPWSALVTGSVEGVDAEGNIVYSMSKVFVGPETMDSEFWAIIDSLPEDQKDRMMDMFDTWKETADLETGIDTFKQDMAEKIMQGAAAVALGGALATAEFTSLTTGRFAHFVENSRMLKASGIFFPLIISTISLIFLSAADPLSAFVDRI